MRTMLGILVILLATASPANAIGAGKRAKDGAPPYTMRFVNNSTDLNRACINDPNLVDPNRVPGICVPTPPATPADPNVTVTTLSVSYLTAEQIGAQKARAQHQLDLHT